VTGEVFGEVRSLVQEAPSVEAWGRLCALLDARADEGTLGYVRDHIERWPDGLRALPDGWLARAMRRERDARLGLARGLRVVGVTPRELEAALSHPDLTGLTWLSVRAGKLGDAGAKALAAAAPVALTRLEVSGCRVGDAGAKALAGSGRLVRLEELDLSGNRVRLEGVRALARGSWPRLRALDLRGNPLGARAARALAAADGMGALERLELDVGRLSVGSIEALATSPTLGEAVRGAWAKEWERARAERGGAQ
jgi:hypothetical protein